MKSGEIFGYILYCELYKELRIFCSSVSVFEKIPDWRRYRVLKSLIRFRVKQRRYFLVFKDLYIFLYLDAPDHGEFESYQRVSYWHVLSQVILLKRGFYRKGLLGLRQIRLVIC